MEASSHTSLAGKTAIITGAARGIGLASAETLGLAGANVILWDVGDLQPALDQLRSRGIHAQGDQVDVADRKNVQSAIAAVSSQRLDILVTAAGILGTTINPEQLDETEFDRVIAINLKGTFWPIQAALSAMRPHGGKIVCIGSLAGEIGSLLSGVPYTASKGAVHAMVKWIARRVASDGIYANVIAPGLVETEMTRGKDLSPDYCPLRRIGTAQDIADAVLFLASPASNYITGTVLNINGGFFMG